LTNDQRAWLLDRLEREGGNLPGVKGQPFVAFRTAAIWALAFVYFRSEHSVLRVSMWLPNLIHSVSGVSNVVIGLLSAIPYLAAVIVMIWVGVHSDRSGERRWHTALLRLQRSCFGRGSILEFPRPIDCRHQCGSARRVFDGGAPSGQCQPAC